MPPANLLAVKQQVLNSRIDKIEPLAARMLGTEDPDTIIELFHQLNFEPNN
jgi:phosphoenolpyruvate-protein phosphotransferase (PTS system enzyme I)